MKPYREPMLLIWCPACKRKVELAIAKLQTGTCVCTCGKPIKMTPEFAAIVQGMK